MKSFLLGNVKRVLGVFLTSVMKQVTIEGTSSSGEISDSLSSANYARTVKTAVRSMVRAEYTCLKCSTYVLRTVSHGIMLSFCWG